MITKKELDDMAIQVPTYEFVEQEADAPVVSPVKRIIAKMQETATTFSLYEVYQALAHIDKMIEGAKAEIAAHGKRKELFLAELAIVERDLGVSDMEKQYQAEVIAEIAVAEALKRPVAETLNPPAPVEPVAAEEVAPVAEVQKS